MRPAVGALPSITPIGMAALLPGAARSFCVVEQGGKLGARIDDTFLPDLAARKKFAAARVPKLVDVALDELLSLQPSKLAKKIEGRRSSSSGRKRSTTPARQASPSRRGRSWTRSSTTSRAPFAARGGGHRARGRHRRPRPSVLRRRPRRVDADRRSGWRPGRAAPALLDRSRRRHAAWVRARRGVRARLRVGSRVRLPDGMRRLQGRRRPRLPPRRAVAAGAGDPGAHRAPEGARLREADGGPVTASGLPEAVTNRIFSVTLQLGGQKLSLFASAMVVRPLLMSAGKQVGAVGMAIDAELDRAPGA